jgi:hypothetical protein
MFPRATILAVVSLALIAPAFAEQPPRQDAPIAAAKANVPKAIGKFDDWTAATYLEAGQQVCYAFTRPLSSIPSLAGRGAVSLTVTERASGRDAVAIEAGFAFAPNATINVRTDKTELEFYTHQRSGFARNHQDAVTAFRAAGHATVRSPGPREATITDTFSLKGFSAAYEAIGKACPPK